MENMVQREEIVATSVSRASLGVRSLSELEKTLEIAGKALPGCIFEVPKGALAAPQKRSETWSGPFWAPSSVQDQFVLAVSRLFDRFGAILESILDTKMEPTSALVIL